MAATAFAHKRSEEKEGRVNGLVRASQVTHWESICLPVQEMQETKVQSLEKKRVIHSGVLAWKFHGQRSVAGYSPWGCKELNMAERTLEKAMAPHSSTLAWKIPWTEEPGGLQSMRSLRVGHDGATSLSLFTFMHWRRKWQPTPVFLPGETQGQRSLVGGHLWGRTESDTTEAT